MQVVTQGLIIKEQAVGESDRLVTILTKDEGVVRAFARRAKNLKDSKNAATGLLCYSRLKLSKGRDTYNVNEAFPIEVFFGLRKDVTALALAQYFCQLAVELVPEGVESSEYLRLVLNALHFLCQGTRPQLLLKAIVELRMVSEAGYMPNLAYCANCGAYQAERMYFKINRGELYCKSCYIHTGDPCAPLSPAALTAIRMMASIVPLVLYIVIIILMAGYDLDKRMPEINKVVEARRAEAAAKTAAKAEGEAQA